MELLYLESKRMSTAGDLQLKLLTGRDENPRAKWKIKIPMATKEKAASFTGIATSPLQQFVYLVAVMGC